MHSTTTRTVIGAVVAVVVLAVLAIATVGTGSSDPPGAMSTAPAGQSPPGDSRSQVPRRDPADPLAMGRPDAPVVIAEWGDFQCPFCREYATGTEPELVRRQVDTGQVRLEWHDFAYLGPESVLAARAARAAGRQGRFWVYHDALYREQAPENSGALTDESLAALAGRLGLDVGRFRSDYADPAIADAVTADQQYGSRLGVTGVPSFVIGDDLIFGAQPLPVYEQAVAAARPSGR